jgi:hypothetical protein
MVTKRSVNGDRQEQIRDITFCDDTKSALGTDEQLRGVEPGCRFPSTLTSFDDFSRRKNDRLWGYPVNQAKYCQGN